MEVDIDLRWISSLPTCLSERHVSHSTKNPTQLLSFDITTWPAGLRSIHIEGTINVEMNEWTPPSLTHLLVPSVSSAGDIRWPATCKKMAFRRLRRLAEFRLSELVIPEGVEEVNIGARDSSEELLIDVIYLASTVRSVALAQLCTFEFSACSRSIPRWRHSTSRQQVSTLLFRNSVACLTHRAEDR
jgi:hypothetical protein